MANYDSPSVIQQEKKHGQAPSTGFKQLQSAGESSTFGHGLFRRVGVIVIWHFPIPIQLWVIAVLLTVILFIPRLRELILGSWISWAVVAFLFIAGSLLIPSQNHLLGDGLTHLGNPERTIASTEPLDILVHHLVYKITGSSLWSYRVVAFVCGLFYLSGITLLLRRSDNRLEQAIIALAFMATGTIQFYFGYVESYTLLHVFTLFFIVFSWRDLERDTISLVPLLFFGLALASHFSAISLLPAVVYLYRKRLGSGIWWLAAGVLLAGFVVGRSVNLSKILVPFWQTEFSAYSLLSLNHLRDLANILLLSGPTFVLVAWPGGIDRRQRLTLFALAGTLGFAVLVDPKIGAFRDWDLLSIFALPLAALVALRAPRHKAAVALLVAVIVLRVVPWLLFNNQPQYEYVKAQVNADLHYSAQYDKGQRLESWGLILERIGDDLGAEDAWTKRLEIVSNDVSTLTMIAPLQLRLKKYDQAYRYYEQLAHSDRSSVEYVYQAAYSAFAAGKLQDGIMMFQELPEDSLSDPRFSSLYAALLSAQGNHTEAMEILKYNTTVVGGAPLLRALAQSAVAEGDDDVARVLNNKAAEFDSIDAAGRAHRDSLFRR